MAERIMPVGFLSLSVVVLLALAALAIGLRTFTPDARILPTSSPVRFGYDPINEQFRPGTASPIEVVVQSAAPLGAAEVRVVQRCPHHHRPLRVLRSTHGRARRHR
jgi:uncharacterized membrane protein YdfJ with MMPL/SSD domain